MKRSGKHIPDVQLRFALACALCFLPWQLSTANADEPISLTGHSAESTRHATQADYEQLRQAAALTKSGKFAAAATILRELAFQSAKPSRTVLSALDLLSWCYLESADYPRAEEALAARIEHATAPSEAPVTRNHLLLWYAMRMQGKENASRMLLQKMLDRALSGAGLCNTDIARHLLGEIGENALFALREENSEWCSIHWGEGSLTTAYFWAALRNSLAGSLSPADRQRLILFLQRKLPHEFREATLAKRLLGGVDVQESSREARCFSGCS